jgi:hypothetical protein
MAFKMNPGRGDYAKTGKGIPMSFKQDNPSSPNKMDFPIKPSTKLKEGESVLVKGPGGRTFQASSVQEAMEMRNRFRQSGAQDTSLTGVTELSSGLFTEQRRDDRSGELRTEQQEISLARSKKDPKPSVKSKEAAERGRDYTSTFSLQSTGEENSPVGLAYDRIYDSPNQMKKYNKKK